MQVLDRNDYKIVILETTNEDEELILNSYYETEVIYVAMEGYFEFNNLSKNRFLVKNPESPFSNHLMWEGLLDSAEQEEYIEKCCKKFWETDKQMLIEDYQYEEDEPFYDYSK
tara:strand:- start:13 stop:351 length:339 start_codon:yes stop_codon:yes gene_type:complete